METSSSSLTQKISISFNIALLAAVLYLLAAKDEKPMIVEESPICKDYSKEPLNGISFGTAQNMFTNYKSHYDKIGHLDNGEIDAQSVWFDLETLKKYFYKIEDTLLKQRVSVAGLKLGIRIYYAAYPDKVSMANDPSLKDLPSNYEYHHTVFMVPTFNDATDAAIKHDFNPWYPDLDAQSQLPTSIPDILKRQKDDPALVSGFILAIDNSLYNQNHGQVGPPPQSKTAGTTYFRQLGQ